MLPCRFGIAGQLHVQSLIQERIILHNVRRPRDPHMTKTPMRPSPIYTATIRYSRAPSQISNVVQYSTSWGFMYRAWQLCAIARGDILLSSTGHCDHLLRRCSCKIRSPPDQYICRSLDPLKALALVSAICLNDHTERLVADQPDFVLSHYYHLAHQALSFLLRGET